MAFNKFAPKSGVKPAAAKPERKSFVLKCKEVGEEKSALLCFMRETMTKKGNQKFLIGSVAARDEEGNIIRNEKGYPEDSGTVFLVFFDKQGPGAKLLVKNEGDAKAADVCALVPSTSGKDGVFMGKDESGNLFFIDNPMPKKK